jgi:hypothetical protein
VVRLLLEAELKKQDELMAKLDISKTTIAAYKKALAAFDEIRPTVSAALEADLGALSASGVGRVRNPRRHRFGPARAERRDRVRDALAALGVAGPSAIADYIQNKYGKDAASRMQVTEILRDKKRPVAETIGVGQWRLIQNNGAPAKAS